MGPTEELTNDEPSPPILKSADIGVETNGAESQPEVTNPSEEAKGFKGHLNVFIETV